MSESSLGPEGTPPEGAEQETGSDTSDQIPPGALPPLRCRDLPEPVPLRRMMGPSIILAGLALGSGEFILWPYITYKSQFVFFWACLLGVTTQYFLNMEITRWSLATGESAVTGFTRLNRHWAWVFLILNIVPWVFPGWATGAAQLVSWLVWGGEFRDGAVVSPYVPYLAIAGLVGCALVLTAGRVVYVTVERIQMVLVGLVILLVIVLACLLVRGDAVTAQLAGAFDPRNVLRLDEIVSGDLAVMTLLGAIAFAGAGGTLNLGQSNYVKDKGYGMGRYIGRITSPITGQEEAISDVGFHFEHTPENLSRWRRWWRAASWEHFLTFYLTCLACLVLLTLITYSIFYGADGVLRPGLPVYSKGLAFIWGEAVELEKLFGGGVRVFFLLMGVALLLTTEFGVLDAASRVSTDIVKVSWLRDSRFWTESRIYYAFLWGTVAFGTVILLVGVERAKDAFQFVQISAAMNGGVMFLYSMTLLYMNRWRLPVAVRAGRFRVVVLGWSVLFFGYFSLRAGWHLLQSWFAG